jgi:rubrerythrin
MTDWLFDFMLRLSYSSELGAATAYRGHAANVRSEADRAAVQQVHEDELRHRADLKAIMDARGVGVWWPFEWFFLALGTSVAFGCRFWGDWASATGAAMFEVNGVSEYQRLAALAARLGEPALVEKFGHMEVQERDHRDLFRAMASGTAPHRPLGGDR